MSGSLTTPPPTSRIKVIAVVSFYMVAALVMVFVNKAVLNSTPDLPFSFLFIQMMIAVILLHIVSYLSRAQQPRRIMGYPETGTGIELPKLALGVAWKLTPYLSIGVIGLVFNTLCLRDVDASFFQIARGMQLPLTIVIASIQSRSVPRRAILTAAAIVSGGFFYGVSPSSFYVSRGTSSATVTSLVYGFLSSFMIALHAVLIKPAHAVVDGSVIQLTYWTNLGSAIAIAPFIVLNGEVAVIIERNQRVDPDWQMFLVGSAVTGLFGFLLGMAGVLSVTNTSATTHMFSSAARTVLQTVLGVMIFGDIISPNRASSIALITIGALYYTWIKSRRGNGPPPPLPLHTPKVKVDPALGSREISESKQ